jgi:hypothetical protein
MDRIIVDDALRNKLRNLTESLELCDESGRMLARLIPASQLPNNSPWGPPISAEELRRREKSDKWYTTEEVLAHLRGLENQFPPG